MSTVPTPLIMANHKGKPSTPPLRKFEKNTASMKREPGANLTQYPFAGLDRKLSAK